MVAAKIFWATVGHFGHPSSPDDCGVGQEGGGEASKLLRHRAPNRSQPLRCSKFEIFRPIRCREEI